jgi:hypothetical protein
MAVGLSVISLTVALLVAELGFRMYTGETVEPNGLFTRDDVIGVGLTPGFQGAMKTAEFEYHVSINQLGMRDGEIAGKDPDTTRLLLVGDSFTFGLGVEIEQTAAKLLERRLAGSLGRRVEVLNGGFPGYGTFQELLAFRKLAPILKPDIVVWMFFVGDDWYGNGPMTPPDEARASLAEQLRIHSSVFRFADRLIFSRFKGRDHYEIHRTSPSPEFLQRMHEALTHLEEARRLAAAGGAQFLVVLCPRYSQVYDDAWDKARLVYWLSDDYARSQPNERFARDLEADGFWLMDLLPPMSAEARRRPLHFPIDGHWNRDGNAFVADALADAVTPRLTEAVRRPGADHPTPASAPPQGAADHS